MVPLLRFLFLLRPWLLLGLSLGCIHLLNLRLLGIWRVMSHQELHQKVSQHRHKCRLLHRNRRGHALPKATGPVLPLAQQGGDNESSSDELIPMIAASRHNCLKPLALRNQKVMQIPMLPDTTRMKKAILSLMKKTGLCSLRNKSCAAIPNRARCRDTKAVVWWTFRGVTSRIRFDKTRYRPSHKNRSDIREEYGLLTREDEALSLSR